ncbi:hypothetical protein F5141DRAFT_1062870 [Pisolithus sp. B1]|nr:hypothetical protein F5141DRAFT_1062870 [Pisolithus sp. B1]
MDLPELAEDGCNWQTYSSWVLKAISEDGLMGHLDGSETRPTTPKLLQEYGAGWTPRTNEERDVVTAWKTADNVWHQRAAMAHQFIIYGLPNSILMLCMHLDTPRKAFAYLECRYGPIPRPESIKVADEAMPQCDMQSEQYATEEGAQGTYNSNNEPIYSPEGEDSLDILNDCTETKSRYLTPETEVVDARHVEPYLLEVEVGDTGGMWPDECANALEAPDECSQRASNKVEEGNNLLELSSEALESQGDLPDTTSERAKTQTGLRKPETEVVDTWQVVNVLPMVEVGTTGQTWQDERANTLEVSDERSQGADDKAACRNSPGGHEDPLDSPSDCAETEAGHVKPEAKVVDMQQVGLRLLGVGVEATGVTRPDEHTNVLGVPDEKGQHVDDIAEHANLPESRSEVLEPADNISRQAGGHSIESGPQIPSEDDQCTHTSQITYLTHVVPLWLLRGTEGTYLECTMAIPSPCTSKKTCPNKEDQDGERETSLQLQETRQPPPERDRMALGLSREKGCWYDDTVSSRSQHGERKAKCRNGLPVPPETPPNGCTHPPETYRVLRRCGRLKSKAESISSDQTRRNAYRVQAAPKWPLPLLLAPSNRSLDPARGSWTMNVHYNEVRHVRQVETRGRTYRIAGIPMRLLQLLTNSSKRFIHPVGGLWMTKVCYNEMRRARQVETRGGTYRTACILMQLLLFLSDPSKRLQNIGNTYWREGVPTGSTRNNAKWQGNIPMAIWWPRSSSMRQDIEHRAKWPNDLPTPFKPTRYDLSHLPGTLRDPRRRGRIKMKTENISRSETRGGKASILTITISPPREIAKPLWNVANTYWRHGIPPGRTRNIKKSIVIRYGGLATTFSFEFYILHPYLITQWSFRGCVGV